MFHDCLVNDDLVDEFMQRMGHVCYALDQEMKQYNPLAGLLLECNLFNLWNLFRNYKNKQAASSANKNPCALVAQQLLKFHAERLVVATDRFFSTAICSGIQIPPSLSHIIFKIQQNARSRTVTAWKTLAGGRRMFMSLVAELTARFTTLDLKGLLDSRTKAFFKLSFPPCRVQSIVDLLGVIHNQKITDMKSLCIPRAKKRTPHMGVFGGSGAAVGNSPLPEVLLTEFRGDDMIRGDICDVNPFLFNPEEFLATDFFIYIKRFYGMGVYTRDISKVSSDAPQGCQQSPLTAIQNVTPGSQNVVNYDNPLEGTSAQPLQFMYQPIQQNPPAYPIYTQFDPNFVLCGNGLVQTQQAVVSQPQVALQVQTAQQVLNVDPLVQIPMVHVGQQPTSIIPTPDISSEMEDVTAPAPRKSSSKRKRRSITDDNMETKRGIREQIDNQQVVSNSTTSSFSTIDTSLFPFAVPQTVLTYSSDSNSSSFNGGSEKPSSVSWDTVPGTSEDEIRDAVSQVTRVSEESQLDPDAEDCMLDQILQSLYGLDSTQTIQESLPQNVSHSQPNSVNSTSSGQSPNPQASNSLFDNGFVETGNIDTFSLHQLHLNRNLFQ